jgi:hypothetical protein
MRGTASKPRSRTNAWKYQVCGITIRSDWKIAYCEPHEARDAVVDIVECSADDLEDVIAESETLPSLPAWFRITHLNDGSTFLHFPDLADFLVSADGHLILARQLDAAYLDGFFTYLLGHALSYSLLQFGIEQLHATCVTVNGSAVAFLGDTGYGKSTLAAAFVREGHRLVTDDMLVLQTASDGVYVKPALARIKLFPEVAEYLLGGNMTGGPLNAGTRKAVIPLESYQFYGHDVKLSAIYTLAPPTDRVPDQELRIIRLSKTDAFVELCKATFNPYVPGRSRSENQFGFATQLAASIPVSSLVFANGLSQINSIRDAVLADLG